MKTLINLIFIVTIFGTQLTASANPTNTVKIIKAEKVEVTVHQESAELFTAATFNSQSQTFEFSTGQDISFIQIFNEGGQLEFQLPVMANKVKISKALFDSGDHKLGFMFDGQKEIKFTKVTIR